jgi:hypothetical protein
MSRIRLEEVHIIPNVYTPVDIDGLAGAKSPMIVLMKNYAQALVLINWGVPKAAAVVTIESCLDVTPSVATAIMFPYYRFETSSILANGDVHGARTWTTTAAAGLIPVATTTPACYVIEIRSSMLLAGHIGFRVCIADPGAASVGSCSAILSGGRFQDSNLTSMAVV